MKHHFDIIILGLNAQGLFLLREFSRIGLRVLGMGMKGSMGLSSRYGHKIALSNLHEIEEILTRYAHNESEIHITSDAFLNYLVDLEHEMFFKYKCFPNYKSVSIFRDKILTQQLAHALNIPYIPSYKITEIDQINYNIFPSIAKWNRRYSGVQPFKTKLINSFSDIEKLKRNILGAENLIVQPHIPGGPASDISYGGYLLKGKAHFHIIITQKRQYPYPSGLASFVEEYTGKFSPQIKVISDILLTATDYSGFVEVECRVDEQKKQLFLIEVNPRACGWIKILKKKYLNFDITSIPTKLQYNQDTIAWANLIRDLRAVINMLLRNHALIKPRDIVADYMEKPILDILELDDVKPFIYQFKKLLLKTLRS